MRIHPFDFLAAASLCALCSATVWAAEPVEFVQEEAAAIATDAPTTPTPQEVAREVLRLQEEMGGSIVAGFGEIPSWAPHPSSPPRGVARPRLPIHESPVVVDSPVVVLREVSWQLERAAHRLELIDLYDQADALRETAAMLRKEARSMKGERATARLE